MIDHLTYECQAMSSKVVKLITCLLASDVKLGMKTWVRRKFNRHYVNSLELGDGGLASSMRGIAGRVMKAKMVHASW